MERTEVTERGVSTEEWEATGQMQRQEPKEATEVGEAVVVKQENGSLRHLLRFP